MADRGLGLMADRLLVHVPWRGDVQIAVRRQSEGQHRGQDEHHTTHAAESIAGKSSLEAI